MTLPTIEPIAPVLRKVIPVGGEWRYELKLDGFRGMLYIDRDQRFFRSKKMDLMQRFQQLADSVAAAVPVRDAIFDGEIVVLDDGLPDFNALLHRRGTPQYAAFDLLWLNGRDLRGLSYLKRKAALKKLLARQTAIGYVEHHTAPELFTAAAKLDLEGVVAKRTSDVYAPTVQWVKVRHAAYSQKEGRGELFHKSKQR